ncbi:MAG: hypothetical protein CM1200mP18_19430 [Gammaproteobacteria bacterium]|nr:MAG: hypothetical protein CM1200mP18_19430 [Gammaproteobacteria bacterium]
MGATVQRSNYAQVYTYMENKPYRDTVGQRWVGTRALGKGHQVPSEPGFYMASLQPSQSEEWNSLSKAQQDIVTARVWISKFVPNKIPRLVVL